MEEITNPKWKVHNMRLVYPPNILFSFSYEMWKKHQKCYWTANEIDPRDDRNKFEDMPTELKKIVLTMTTLLMHGDTVVLDVLSSKMTEITAREVQVFLDDQTARENTHQEVYGKMLDVVPIHKANVFRSPEFKAEHFGQFSKIMENYKDLEDVRVFFLLIAICECLMFAPMFQTICYSTYAGYTPKLGEANVLVMRDENLHYEHARGIVARFNTPLNKTFAREIVDKFTKAIERMIVDIIRDYSSKDGQFSVGIALRHFRYTHHRFMKEMSLYMDEEEERKADERSKREGFDESPARLYMQLPNMESIVNQMESSSTVYKTHDVGGARSDIKKLFSL